MGFLDRLFGRRPRRPDPRQLLETIFAFIQAETWAESRRIVEAHPELLSDEADGLLGQLADAARAQGDENARRVFDEHRALLRRCREVGVERAFAEKMLPPEALAQAEAAGLTPEQALEAARAAAQMPPELRELLVELAAAGVETSSPEDLERLLEERPDLREKLEEAARVFADLGTGPPVPPEFQEDLRRAVEGEQRYQQTGDLAALNEAVAAWERILNHPAFAQADERFQLAAWNGAGGAYLRRYWRQGQIADLDRALSLWQEAVRRTPEDAPDLPSILNNLGIGLSAHYARTGRMEDLEEAIRVYQEAVRRTPEDSPNLPMYLNNLGTGLSDRYARTGRMEDLEEAIGVWRGAVRRTPPDSPDLPMYLSNLGIGLHDRYARTGRMEDLEEAIRVWREAVRRTPPDSPALPGYLNSLGNGLRARYARTGRMEDLEEAIGVFREAVRRTPPDSPDLPGYLNSLGNGLSDRYARTGRMEDLEEAIRVFREAIRRTPEDAPDLPMYLTNLGAGLRDRYARTGRLEDLEEAIRVWREAVRLTPEDAPDFPSRLNNLGAGLRDRYARTGHLEDLQEAIRVYREAVRRTPPDSSDLPGYLNNLGAGLSDRYARTGRMEDLEETIGVWREAVRRTPPDSPDLPMYLSNLGIGLRDRYARTGHLEDLEEAVRVWREAVRRTPPDSPDLPGYLNNLGTGLSDRYARTGHLEDLEEAIRVYREAVRRTPPDSPDLPMYLTNLGTGLRDRYARTGHLEDLEEAIGASREAVRRTPEGSPDLPGFLTNLGTGLSDRYARTGRLEDLEEAIRAYRKACERGSDKAPEAALMAGGNWGNWAVERREWVEAVEAYGYAMQTIRRLFVVQYRREQKAAWLREVQAIPARLAYAHAQRGDLERAVEALEAGRTRLLRETMEQNRRDLERLPALGFNRLHQRYQEARQRFRDLLAQGESPRRPADWPQQMKAAWEEVQAAEQAIREEVGAVYPEFAHFMEDPTFDQVLPAARDAPLVYLLATPAGGLALIVHAGGDLPGRPDGVTAVRLPDLTEEALNRRLWSPTPEEDRRINDHLQQGRVAPEDIEAARGGYLSMYRLWRIGITDRRIPRKTREALRRAWFQTLDVTTRWLWEAVMGEVVETLTPTPAAGGDRPVAPTGGRGEGVRAITLIPTGLLSLLPLHAAWREDPAAPTGHRYALDDLCITYAPGAHALRAARRVAARTAPDGVFVVDNPDGTLRFSDEEVASVLEHFPPERQRLLGGESATREAVLRELPRYPVLHFSTHGWADPDDPLRSGLRMAESDHPLTLADFLDLRLEGARLAVLSACETAVPGTRLPEEVIGLPTGLLQAGVAGVVGSLWAVGEISTALLMARFYDLWRGEGLAPPQALRQAQVWLRDSTNEEKEALFRTALPELIATRMAEETARGAFWDMLRRRPEGRDFAHPYYWAGFGYTGT